jgi:hypothetical protein
VNSLKRRRAAACPRGESSVTGRLMPRPPGDQNKVLSNESYLAATFSGLMSPFAVQAIVKPLRFSHEYFGVPS